MFRQSVFFFSLTEFDPFFFFFWELESEKKLQMLCAAHNDDEVEKNGRVKPHFLCFK